jgi:hypothetical protein
MKVAALIVRPTEVGRIAAYEPPIIAATAIVEAAIVAPIAIVDRAIIIIVEAVISIRAASIGAPTIPIAASACGKRKSRNGRA